MNNMKPVIFSIDCATKVSTLDKFWNSTGFTPATLLLTRDMQQQIAYFGSIPRQGLRYARVHFLLELVSVTFDGQNATSYDWSRLDSALDTLVMNNMAPIFELMGNPNGSFTSFRDDLQLHRWRNLIFDLSNHLMTRYGRSQVESWYFESWNEPDAGWWHEFHQDEEAFCNYYDACVHGLKTANPALVIGGPGTCQTLSPLFKFFLAHCDSGKNYLTGEIGTNLDFISIHEKAAPARKEDITPLTDAMIEREIEILNYIRTNHPRFASLPFMNNECDPQVGWKDHHTWHGRPYYAAWIIKSVDKHLTRMVDDLSCNYAVLSNDNGFIGEWGNRTLLTRFGPAQWIEDGQTRHPTHQAWNQRDFSTPDFSMIKKPAFSAMTLLSLLGDQRLETTIQDGFTNKEIDEDLNVIATRDQDSIILLVYYSRDRLFSSGQKTIQVVLENFPHRTAQMIHFRIDENHGDPFRLWEDARAPIVPDQSLLSKMRMIQEPQYFERREITSIVDQRSTFEFEIPLHAVSLIYLAPKVSIKTYPKIETQVETYSSVHGIPEFLLSWQTGKTTEILEHEIYYSAFDSGPFTKINVPHLLSTACMLDRTGFYQIKTSALTGDSFTITPVFTIP
jgi:L-iduronidase